MMQKNLLWNIGRVAAICLCLAALAVSGCKKEDTPKAPEGTEAPKAPEAPKEQKDVPQDTEAPKPDEPQAANKDETERRTGDATKAPATMTVVNNRCPITGARLDQNRVSAELTRTFDGQKVGFSDAQAIKAWDKLSDQQRRSKLAAVTESKKPSGRPGGSTPSGSDRSGNSYQ